MFVFRLITILFLGLLLCQCATFTPPFNQFNPPKSSIGYLKIYNSQRVIKELYNHDIQHVQIGDTQTLIVPTDRYFYFNTSKLNDLCYEGLTNIVRLIQLYRCSTIFVAGFTDDIGSYKHKKTLSQAQAETMITYLWANGIAAKRLHAEGYGEKFAVAPNRTIHSSAYNRRLEIQWMNEPCTEAARPHKYSK